LKSVDVLVVAKKGTPYCASCGGGRTLEDITLSVAKQLKRRYGNAVSVRFVDVNEAEEAGLSTEIVSRSTRLPLVLIGGKVRYRGLFSPTFIRRDVREILERQGHVAARENVYDQPARADRDVRERDYYDDGWTRRWLRESGAGWATSSRSSGGGWS